MKIVVHTMEYHGGAMVSDLPMKIIRMLIIMSIREFITNVSGI